MFGGIAALGQDRLAYAAFDGTVALFDVESGGMVDQFDLRTAGPQHVRLTSCAADEDGTLLLADARNRRVRRVRVGGLPVVLYGALSNPAIRQQDEPGVLDEPCSVLPLGDFVLVCSGGDGVAQGVQRFHAGGAYRSTFPHPIERRPLWRRAQGLALVEGKVWIAETEAEAIRVYTPEGLYIESIELPDEARRPFRLADDGYEGVLVVCAPGEEDDPRSLGIARVRRDGMAEGWAVPPGEDAGQVSSPFDVTVFPDGRFAVADLPLGAPPDVRIQLFRADGRLERLLIEDVTDLAKARRAYSSAVLAESGSGARELCEQARVHHSLGGGTTAELEEARRLYRAALAADPALLLARLGLADLLHHRLKDPAGAEEEYRRAIEAGGGEAGLLCRIAECRRDQGDLDGAISILDRALKGAEPPEDFHDRLEELGDFWLQRAGESPERLS